MFAFATPTGFGVRFGASTANACSPRSVTRMAIPDASPSMPFMKKPKNLDSSMVGYAGFDPFGFAERMDPSWLQEAEIKHCRVAMLGVVGILVQEFFQLPFGSQFQEPVATEAVYNLSLAGWAQIFFFIGACELYLHKGKIWFSDMHVDGAVPGELGFNPLNLPINEKSKLQEIKNGRLAMCAVGGFIHSMLVFKTPIIAQLLDFKPMSIL